MGSLDLGVRISQAYGNPPTLCDAFPSFKASKRSLRLSLDLANISFHKAPETLNPPAGPETEFLQERMTTAADRTVLGLG